MDTFRLMRKYTFRKKSMQPYNWGLKVENRLAFVAEKRKLVET